jgi:hypothetical protein
MQGRMQNQVFMLDDNCKAILDLKNDDHEGVYLQGTVFVAKLYLETILYPSPIIPELDFKVLVKNSGDCNTAAEKGGDVEIAAQIAATITLHKAMGDKLIPYINSLWKGNRVNLEKSGAKISAERSKVPPPETPVISRVVRGPVTGSIKIYLMRGVKSSQKKRSKKQYRIFMFEKEDDTKGIEIGSAFDSRKLIGYDVPESVYRYFSVRAENSGGSSLLASKVRFFLSI